LFDDEEKNKTDINPHVKRKDRKKRTTEREMSDIKPRRVPRKQPSQPQQQPAAKLNTSVLREKVEGWKTSMREISTFYEQPSNHHVSTNNQQQHHHHIPPRPIISLDSQIETRLPVTKTPFETYAETLAQQHPTVPIHLVHRQAVQEWRAMTISDRRKFVTRQNQQ
jgi:hypothetical protein